MAEEATHPEIGALEPAQQEGSALEPPGPVFRHGVGPLSDDHAG